MSKKVTKTLNFYNKKCLGCGQYFSKDINSSSYVVNPNENTKYCKRCFQLKHYGKLDNSLVDKNQVQAVLDSIDFKNNFVICVVDLLDIGSLKRMKNKNIHLIAINKFSLFPKNFKLELTIQKIESLLDELGYSEVPFVLYDAFDTFNISSIYEEIKKQSKLDKKIYIVGNTNSGKSSLINALLRYVKKQDYLSVSSFPNTTLNLSKIKLDKFTSIIDTPGIIDEQNFVTNLDNKSLVKLSGYKNFGSKTFVIKDNNQSFFVESFAYINIKEVYENTDASITFYSLKDIRIHRTKQDKVETIKNKRKELFNLFVENDDNHFDSFTKELQKDTKYNLIINGIALVSLKNIKKIEVFYLKQITPFLFVQSLI